MTKPRLLILGGTGEARQLAVLLVDQYDTVTSLAGRTQDPMALAGTVRQGGFGGVSGFLAYLEQNRPAAVIDATHPYVARMGTTAVQATAQMHIPFLRLERPAWTQQPGDDWHLFETIEALVKRLPSLGTHGLITLGGANLGAFSRATGMRLTLRAIDPPDPLPDHPAIKVLLDRGPFTLESERALLTRLGIDVLVARNAGGSATRAKIDAARMHKLPVALLARPARPDSNYVNTVAAAVRWVEGLNL